MPESESAIERYARDASPLVRAAVAQALRAIPTSGADDALANAIVDPVPYVRLAAAGAFAGRGLSDPSFTSLASAAEHDPDRTVRQAATESLGTTGMLRSARPPATRSPRKTLRSRRRGSEPAFAKSARQLKVPFSNRLHLKLLRKRPKET
jgi:HEAT repeat protein